MEVTFEIYGKGRKNAASDWTGGINRWHSLVIGQAAVEAGIVSLPWYCRLLLPLQASSLMATVWQSP